MDFLLLVKVDKSRPTLLNKSKVNQGNFDGVAWSWSVNQNSNSSLDKIQGQLQSQARLLQNTTLKLTKSLLKKINVGWPCLTLDYAQETSRDTSERIAAIN